MIIGVGTLGADTYALGATGGAATVALTTAQLPAHTHDVNPAAINSGNNSAGHTHSIPALSGSTNNTGAHTHSPINGSYLSYNDGSYPGANRGDPGGGNWMGAHTGTSTTSNGAHAHTVTTSASTTGGESASHTHSVDIPNTTSTSVGSGTAHENRPPYRAYVYCESSGTPVEGVTLPNCATGESLKWNGTAWICSAPEAALVPSGAVMAFNLASCPAGWSAVSGAAGRVVVGTGNYAANSDDDGANASFSYSLGATGGRRDHALSTGELASHSHSVDPPATTTSTDGAHNHTPASPYAHFFFYYPGGGYPNGGMQFGGTLWTSGVANDGWTSVAGSHAHTLDIAAFSSATAGSGTAHENRQPYISFLYCQKN